ncbi:hypothetical protein NBRC10512_005482 [Rhodotorula toruloides]|uniref:RHTO0S22e00804g1_1 n=2 Tax=Rhodotorula toruloides TaxID=5286 RepID=A0A061BGA6_RHOTO|nr:MFS transporter, monocarboxylic acid transporter [Rhodotorula toruloides NP11]EMS18895.1 MFS transporter, monocarboxylic acid transporter [Rhodotorula toruloides NP11]CDR48992.1 RHTO0S22e00804g1_1 [Rhodotorula toruloides]
MSSSAIELESLGAPTPADTPATSRPESIVSLNPGTHRRRSASLSRNADGPPDNKEAFDSYPEWKGGWKQVLACFALFFTTLGGVYSWGVFQDALVTAGLAPSSTLAFVGSVQATMEAILAIPIARIVSAYGPRRVALVGSAFVGLGSILAGWCTGSVAGLIITEGFMFGIGQALCFFSAATLPTMYFLRSRNVATGMVYSGAGLGGAVFSLVTAQLLKRLHSLPWTFRTVGLIMTAINVPAALVLKSRGEKVPFQGGKGKKVDAEERSTGSKYFDRTLFKDPRFCLILTGTAVALFPLFVPPFFLPLYSTSIGLSTTTAALILAGFNLSSALGRICFGLGADRLLGSLNALVLCLVTVSVSTLLIWPFADALAPLIVFSVINGFCAGGMFSLIPGTLSSVFGTRRLTVIFSMIVTSWSLGYFLGAPIAGFLLQAYGGPDRGPKAYQPAIFYSGGLSVLAAVLVGAARFNISRTLWKKM